MKIYIASSFNLIQKVELVCKALEKLGYEITEKWWKRVYQTGTGDLVETSDLKKKYDSLSMDEFYSRPECRLSYWKDFKGVKKADILVFVADDKPRAYNGANIELGIALGDRKRCFSIGVLDNSVLYYEVVKTKNIMELLSQINFYNIQRRYLD